MKYISMGCDFKGSYADFPPPKISINSLASLGHSERSLRGLFGAVLSSLIRLWENNKEI